ncbi:MAG: hypothetical protein DDG60_03800 [Anaerolineae bacterium]|nr:MAG: hypothetical protein DDG60_03800 [Anaerolineae bacterium]
MLPGGFKEMERMTEPIKEPSVLDYVKSKLNPWQREKIEIPQADGVSEAEVGAQVILPTYRPWRVILAIGAALFAQWTIETALKPIETQPLMVGLGAYLLSFVLLVWGMVKGEFALPEAEVTIPQNDPQTFRRLAFLASVVLAGLAFTQFGKNAQNQHVFTSTNLTLWLGSIVLFVYSLWLEEPNRPSLWRRMLIFLKQERWQITLTRWSILVLAATVLVVFFRMYNLEGVIAEPFSDQAEKLLDVYDVTQGQYHVFFERNTGREFIQFYWTAFLAWLLGTGVSFFTLKLGTVLIGLFALPYIYLLGKEVGGPRVALFALLLAGTAYWLNTISRIGLRFPLYPAFAAPVLYHLVRGLRHQSRNDFLLAGLFLGLGLHGYSPFRFVPFVVMLGVGLYLIHATSKGFRQQTVMMFVMLVLASVLVFLPLGRYAIDRPDMFAYRALTRIAGDTLPDADTPLERFWKSLTNPVNAETDDPVYKVFFDNTLKALVMFQYDNGGIWVHSVPGRPALDFVSAALYTLGCAFLLLRYVVRRNWLDLFFLLSIPLLMMPSILSLAFPGENPSLNRTGAAAVVVFVIAAQMLDGVYTALKSRQAEQQTTSTRNQTLAFVVVLALLFISILQNYTLEFDRFATQFRAAAWNTSDMGRVIRAFVAAGNSVENAWVVPYPYWVDTRLVGIQSGYPTRDAALWPEEFERTLDLPGNKLFIVKDEDLNSLGMLRALYPNGALGRFDSPIEGKDFWIYTVSDSLTGE